MTGGAAIAKSLYVGTALFVQSTVDASSTSVSGSLAVAGGASVARSLYVGGAIFAQKTADATSVADGGSLTVLGGASIGTEGASFVFICTFFFFFPSESFSDLFTDSMNLLQPSKFLLDRPQHYYP